MTTVTVDRAVLEQALEAMDKATRFMSDSDYVRLNQVIDALRAELAQQEQEPVARMHADGSGRIISQATYNEAQRQGGVPWSNVRRYTTPLYTHQPRREWRELTDEEIRATYGKDLKYRDGDYERFARAIEQALKEKNNG